MSAAMTIPYAHPVAGGKTMKAFNIGPYFHLTIFEANEVAGSYVINTADPEAMRPFLSTLSTAVIEGLPRDVQREIAEQERLNREMAKAYAEGAAKAEAEIAAQEEAEIEALLDAELEGLDFVPPMDCDCPACEQADALKGQFEELEYGLQNAVEFQHPLETHRSYIVFNVGRFVHFYESDGATTKGGVVDTVKAYDAGAIANLIEGDSDGTFRADHAHPTRPGENIQISGTQAAVLISADVGSKGTMSMLIWDPAIRKKVANVVDRASDYAEAYVRTGE